jgi:hypothetical protein
MIIKRFFKVNSNEIVIFNVNFKLYYEKIRGFVTFYKNLYTRLRSRAKKTLAPAPAKSCCSTGSGSATLVGGVEVEKNFISKLGIKKRRIFTGFKNTNLP